MEDGSWKMEVGRWKIEDGSWKITLLFFITTIVALGIEVKILSFLELVLKQVQEKKDCNG